MAGCRFWQLSRNEHYGTGQAWSYDEQQNVWLNFVDTRYNSGPDARFFTTNFAFRIDASALTTNGHSVFVDAVKTHGLHPKRQRLFRRKHGRRKDIGNAGNTGYVATNGSTFTVSGSGMDILNKGDAFRFLYQRIPATGR